MRIDARDVVQRLKELYALGAMPDGTHARVSFSREDAKGRKRFIEYFTALGIPVKEDGAGNIIARMEGSEKALPAIVVGSHLDTVPNGGMYDGALGCVAGWALCDALKKEAMTLRHPLEVVVFADEEGARFGSGMYGSSAFCGALEPLGEDDLDIFGMARGRVLQEFGINLVDAHAAKRDKSTVHFCLELHVEQGASLFHSGIPIGVVSTIAGVRRYEVTVTGQANHSGSTQMAGRKDALVASAGFIAGIPKCVQRLGSDYTVSTVGVIRTEPGSVNVIPGKCVFTLEIRDQDAALMAGLMETLENDLAHHCRENSCEFTLIQTLVHAPAPMSDWVQQAIKDSCHRENIPYAVVPSGAFHDAMMLSAAFPTGMIFIPSVHGVSHSPEEYSTIEHIEIGCNVLLHAVLQLDAQSAEINAPRKEEV